MAISTLTRPPHGPDDTEIPVFRFPEIPEDWVPDPTLTPPRRSHGRPGVEPALTPARPDLEWFRENLIRGMIKKNMTASDVARALWGEKLNAQGNSVAKGRDRMTGYLSGQVHPSEANIVRLCEVLDLTPAQLAIDTSKSGQTAPPRPDTIAARQARGGDNPGGQNHASRRGDDGNNHNGGAGILVFEVIRPGKVRFRFDQVLDEATTFTLLDAVRRIAAERSPPVTDRPEPAPEAKPDHPKA
jgi:hypothetical protein